MIAVEAEPTHYKMMRQHFEDNGFDWREHTLIEAAVAPEAGEVYFTVGAPISWYGQAILPSPDYGYGAVEGVSVKSVPAVTIASILETIDRVDLIDMDIQGAEAGVIAASVEVLGRESAAAAHRHALGGSRGGDQAHTLHCWLAASLGFPM